MEVVVARGIRRLIGLIGRRSWPAGVALEIPRCRSVHTFGMRFALDLVWLDGSRRVVRMDRAVPPWRVRSCRRARSVLELRTPGTEGAGGRAARLPAGLARPSDGFSTVWVEK
jgi:uncharacterized membrane protein (UPF0127 family)